MSDPGYLLIVALTSLLFAFLLYLGEGYLWQGLKRIIGFLWEGIKRFLLPGEPAPTIPRPDYDRIEELERWNREWTHPDLKGFTHVKLANAEARDRKRTPCRSAACGGFGMVFRDGLCKGCYGYRVRFTDTQRLFERADESIRRGVQEALSVTPDAVWGPQTERAIARYRRHYGDDDIVRALTWKK